jgi:hypothetical protein
MKIALHFCVLALFACIGKIGVADEIQPAALRVAAAIDAMNVEQHWPAGVHIDWETGVPDGKAESNIGRHTHCSAFVAAAAKRLGIYILRPPEHGQMLLANAQFDWLAQQGSGRGWQPLGDAVAAQDSANRGYLVVAAYKNHHEDKPGHIAIVRPSEKGATAILAEGPQITQAGTVNYRSIPLKQGFAGHPAAWGEHEVRFYAHAVPEASARN